MHRTIVLDRPLNLRTTLRMQSLWGGNTWLRADATGGWYAQRTPDGPATVHLVHTGDRVEAEAWGPGADRLLDRVPEIIGEHDDPDQWVPKHPVIHELKKRMRGFRLGRVGVVYPRLISAALGQKVTGKEGKGALYAIACAWGETAPGPREDLRLLPEPRELAAKPYYLFHRLGIERHRADLVRRIGSRMNRLERAADMPYPEAHAHLQKLRGIGPWTTGVVVGLALGDPDAVPFGDYHLPNLVSWNLASEPRADDARMAELLEPYAGQRGRVVRALKAGGTAAPKYGPRTSVRDIRDL